MARKSPPDAVTDYGGLPNLPTGWHYSPLSDLVNDRGISYGVVQPGDFVLDGVPFVRVNNLKRGTVDRSDLVKIRPSVADQYQRTALRGYEVLMSLVGTLGNVAVATPDMAGWNVARAVAVLPVLSSIGSDWIAFCLRSPLSQHFIRSRATTTVQATLNLRDVAQIPIPIPPVSERNKISEILSLLDQKIDLNRRMNGTLEEMARTLFRSWFVDFDPVKTKEEGREPDGMDAETAALFPGSFIESEIGPIPEGWSVGTLDLIAQNPRRGIDPKNLDPTTSYTGLEHMPRKSIALTEEGTTADVESGKFLYKQGELLFGKLRPYFHKVGVATSDGACSTDILVIQPQIDWEAFVTLLVSENAFIEHVTACSDGTRMPRTSWGDMVKFRFALPTSAIAQVFQVQTEAIIEQIRSNIFEMRTLTELRDTLIPKLISGEIRLPEEMVAEFAR